VHADLLRIETVLRMHEKVSAADRIEAHVAGHGEQ
jgi:hypothetical protein